MAAPSLIFPAKKNPIHKLQKTFSWSQKKAQDEDSVASVTAALQPEPEPGSPAKAPQDTASTDAPKAAPPSSGADPQPPPTSETEGAEAGAQQLYTIDVPEAAKPGMALKVRLPDRGMVKITVPEGCVPGNQLEFTLPAILTTPQKSPAPGKDAAASGSAAADQAASEMVSSAMTGAIAIAEAAQADEVQEVADTLVNKLVEGVVDEAEQASAKQPRTKALPPHHTGVADVARAATTASKHGGLWGLVSAITDSLSLSAYEEEHKETAEENPFRWF